MIALKTHAEILRTYAQQLPADDEMREFFAEVVELLERKPSNVVSIMQHITLGQLENRVDALTAAILLHGGSKQVFDNLEALHKLVRSMRQDLNERQRQMEK